MLLYQDALVSLGTLRFLFHSVAMIFFLPIFSFPEQVFQNVERKESGKAFSRGATREDKRAKRAGAFPLGGNWRNNRLRIA